MGEGRRLGPLPVGRRRGACRGPRADAVRPLDTSEPGPPHPGTANTTPTQEQLMLPRATAPLWLRTAANAPKDTTERRRLLRPDGLAWDDPVAARRDALSEESAAA